MNLRDKLKFWMALSNYVDMIVRGTSPLSLPDAIANSLSYVKAFGGTEQRNLPDGYIERQFIYMMDDSYLLPNITPEADWHIEMDFQTTALSAAGGINYFGGRYEGSPAGAGIRLGHTTPGKVVLYGFDTNNAYTGSTYNMANNTRYKYVYNNNSASLSTGGTVVDSTTFTPNDTTTSTIVVNGYKWADGSIVPSGEGIYLYSFKAWNGQGELVMDLVPAVQRGTVPVVGFYDTVSGTFKTATAGTFAAGGEAVPTPDTPMDIVSNNGVLKARHQSGLPLGYTLLDYIESDGTQYIDTGVTRGSSDFVAEYDINMVTANGDRFAFAGANWNVSSYLGFDTSDNTFDVGQGATEQVQGALNTRYKIKAEYKVGSIVLSLYDNNGTLLASTTRTSNSWLSGNTNSWLFGAIRGMPSSASFSYTLKSFGGKIWQGTTLVRDFVPAKNSSGVVGMYDFVSGQFFTNAGTGTFTAGNPVSDPVEIYTDGTVETINAHGKNLYNPATTTDDIILTDSGAETPNAGGSVSDYIKIKPNTTYTLSFVRTDERIYTRVCTYSADKTFVGLKVKDIFATAGHKTYTFTTEATAEYVRFCFKSDSTDVQLEQGSTATEYAPYYDGGTATAEMLLKVGDYQDVQSILDGVVTRNVGVKVLDGTEDWVVASVSSVRYILLETTTDSNRYDIISSHFKSDPVAFANMSNNSGCLTRIAAEGKKAVALKAESYATLNDWKQFLADQYAAGTPVIVIYPLATPTTESVAGQTLQVTDGDNVLEITQASLNGLELEAEYQAEQ